jgi:hypothetical protein
MELTWIAVLAGGPPHQAVFFKGVRATYDLYALRHEFRQSYLLLRGM